MIILQIYPIINASKIKNNIPVIQYLGKPFSILLNFLNQQTKINKPDLIRDNDTINFKFFSLKCRLYSLSMKSKTLGKRIKKQEKPVVVKAVKDKKTTKHADEMKEMKNTILQKQQQHLKEMKEMKEMQEKKQVKHKKEMKDMQEKKEKKQKKEETRDASSLDLMKEKESVCTKNRFQTIMENNLKWATKCVKEDPQFFRGLVGLQQPKYLYFGCADSRVPANQILGLQPGEVFVHRNIANLCPPSDINALAVLQYAVEHLHVKDIIIVGHYGCGGVKAAFSQNDFGALEAWLSHLRELRSKYRNSLIGTQEQQEKTLVQLNVKQQVINIARVPIVQKTWRQGRNLFIHGLVYNLSDGILHDVGITLSKLDQVPYQFRIDVKEDAK